MSAPDPVFCDVTELMGNPVRSGIQRVVRELLRQWPGPRPLRLCRFDSTRLDLIELPDAVLPHLLDADEDTRRCSVAELRARIAKVDAGQGEGVPLAATVLVPEVFFDEGRCRNYLWRMEQDPEKIHILFFDFIPWLYPEVIGVERSAPLMWYIRVAQASTKAAFISAASRNAWQQRIVRNPTRPGEVVPLGSDGLQLDRQTFSPSRQRLVALGSIDGRKNQLRILEAFEQLWSEGSGLELVLIGKLFEAEARHRSRLIEAAERQPLFRFIEHASDDQIAEELGHARATIYVSEVEGFGLPPVEGLCAGLPCIVTRAVPSTESFSAGLVKIDVADPDLIAAAVRTLADDQAAAQLWAEAATLELPTWRDFNRHVAEWVG